jgi:hypothetical protein
MRTHATKHATNRVGKMILKNCQILENVLGILSFPSPILRFPSPKIQFSSPKIRFPRTKSDLPKSAFYFLQWLSGFFNCFLTFFNGFPLSPMAFQILQRLSNFPQWLSAFRGIRENLSMARSIRKIAIQALYFFASRSPSFVITAKQYLCLTQHSALPQMFLMQMSLGGSCIIPFLTHKNLQALIFLCDIRLC